MMILTGQREKHLKAIEEREKREDDTNYLARLIVKFCKEHGCIGMSVPILQGIVEFKFRENKK